MSVEDEYNESMDIFPTLRKYQAEHNTTNLKKLCLEIVEFCQKIYSSTQNEQERKIYFDMVNKLQR